MSAKECFISVDVETTGPMPGFYSMFEIGATRVEKPDWNFQIAVAPLSEAGFEQEALDAIGRTRKELTRPDFGYEPREAMNSFAYWVETQSEGRGRPIFVANNAPFDWMFVAWYFEQFGVKNPFGYVALDMKAYFMGLTRCAWRDATLKRMAEYVNVPFEQLPHRALKDAIIQGKIFAKLIDIERSRL